MPLRLQKPNLPKAVYWFSLLAFVLRIVARLHSGIADFWVNGYVFFFRIAQEIAAGRGIAIDGAPTAFRVPLYSIFLAGVTLGHKAFWPIAIVQSLIGAGIVLFAAALARQMFRGAAAEKAAILAAGLTAIYPYYVIHDTALQETSLFTLLTLAAVFVLKKTAYAAKPADGAAAGLLLGLDVLTRATIAPFVLLAPLWLVWRGRTRAGILCAIALAATVTPWLWRNDLLTGAFALSTEAGEELWNGNNGFLFSHYPKESSDLSKEEAFAALSPADQQDLGRIANDEGRRNRWFSHKALQYIQSHPKQTVIDGFRKNAAAFSWLPSPRRGRLADLAHLLSFGPVMLLGCWGMWRRRSRWREDSLIYVLFVTFVLVTAVFWAHTAHRVYLDVYWIVFAAGAVAEMGAGSPGIYRIFRNAASRYSAPGKRQSSLS